MPTTRTRLASASIIAVLTTSAAGAMTTQPAHAAYRSCRIIHNHGAPYQVAARRMSCEHARGAAHYLLNHRHAPRNWRCRLRRLNRGTASCHRHRARFVFWAVRRT